MKIHYGRYSKKEAADEWAAVCDGFVEEALVYDVFVEGDVYNGRSGS